MPSFERQQVRANEHHPVSFGHRDETMFRHLSAGSRLGGRQGGGVDLGSQRFAESCPLRLATPQRCPFGGACHTCPTRVQARLSTGRPDDGFEREADRVAPQVKSRTEPATLQRYDWGLHDVPGMGEPDEEPAGGGEPTGETAGGAQASGRGAWWSSLPDCPCTNPGTTTLGDGWCSEGRKSTHPGAAECFRQVKTTRGPGQQCCYDSEENQSRLMTTGRAAGTPDLIGSAEGENSDGTCNWNLLWGAEHMARDVAPFYTLSFEEYQRGWPPNQGANCSASPTAQ